MQTGSDSIPTDGGVAVPARISRVAAPSRIRRVVHGLRVLVVSTAIGAIINLIVVGLLVWRVEPCRRASYPSIDVGNDTDPICHFRIDERFGTTRAVIARGLQPGRTGDVELPELFRSIAKSRLEEHPHVYVFIEDHRGFPFRCMSGGIERWRENSVNHERSSILLGSARILDWWDPSFPGFGSVSGRTIIPLQPIWWPFLLNSLFYGGLTFGAVRTPVFARSRWRARRGHCRRCGYSLRGLDTPACPECGMSIPSAGISEP